MSQPPAKRAKANANQALDAAAAAAPPHAQGAPSPAHPSPVPYNGARLARNEDHEDEDDNEDEDEDDELPHKPARKSDGGPRSDALYLDTIRRSALDFDFEKVCSVSLSTVNVYACLVCGKYFQGRGQSSHAYTHSLSDNHQVFLNLTTLKFYVLPDGYEVQDASLNDIKYVVNPTYSQTQVAALDSQTKTSLDLTYKPYLPGYIGLNNVKSTDYVNVVIQTLAHVRPIRDFFLSHGNLIGSDDTLGLSGNSPLVQQFGLLLRKMWHSRAFKGQVSPHELLQEINIASKRQFKITEQGDPFMLLSWLLNTLHTNLAKRGVKSPLIFDTFQGMIAVQTQKVVAKTEDEVQLNESKRQQGISEPGEFDAARNIDESRSPFLMLGLDLPPAPLFQDEYERNIIPQVALVELLEKYNGGTVRQYGDTIKMFRITRLPRYLILNIKRFVKNNWTLEKNPTIVNFATRGLDLAPYVENPVGETRYSIVANIVHEGKPEPGQGVYKCLVYNRARDQWYSIQDLIVEEIMPQMVSLGESYIQVWERMDLA